MLSANNSVTMQKLIYTSGNAVNTCPFDNPLDPNAYGNGMPYDELKKLRERGPLVHFDDPFNGVPFWMVTRREECDFISKNPQLFSSYARLAHAGEQDQEGLESSRLVFLNMDPPEQMKHRRIVREVFTPSAVSSYEPRFREIAKQVVDAVAHRGECEFVREVAAELPLIAILEMVDVPASERQQFFEWTNLMFFSDDPDSDTGQPEAKQASIEMIMYALELAAKHKQNPKDNLLGKLVDGKVDGEPLSDAEFGMVFLTLITAGNDSTRTAISQGMRLLMENPDQIDYLLENPDKIENAVEEILRYNTSFITMRRMAMEDVELGGQTIKKGDKVVMHYHTINHDESVFGDDATVFDVRRAERMPSLYKEHRAFGVGQHFCLGTHLARLEIKIMLEEVLPRLRNPKFKQEPNFIKSFFVNGMHDMYITFDPE